MVHAKRRFRPGIAFWYYPCETIWSYPILYLALLLLEALSLIQGAWMCTGLSLLAFGTSLVYLGLTISHDLWRHGGALSGEKFSLIAIREDNKLSGWSDDRTLMCRDARLIL
ncbi:hypothetical protein ACE6H2_010690 [Prunus campanulata]